jgi:hypothetical protein
MLEQVFEGTWEEVSQHANELAGKQVRLTVLGEIAEQKPPPPPNDAMLRVIEQVAKMQEGMRFTSGKDTQRLIREARAGAMYDYDTCE